jgi:hypothetical protein
MLVAAEDSSGATFQSQYPRENNPYLYQSRRPFIAYLAQTGYARVLAVQPS